MSEIRVTVHSNATVRLSTGRHDIHVESEMGSTTPDLIRVTGENMDEMSFDSVNDIRVLLHAVQAVVDTMEQA